MGVHVSYDPWGGRIRNVDHLQPRITICDIGMRAGHRNAEGKVRGIHTSLNHRRDRIRDINYLETGKGIRDIGVGTRNRDTVGLGRYVNARNPVQVCLVVNTIGLDERSTERTGQEKKKGSKHSNLEKLVAGG